MKNETNNNWWTTAKFLCEDTKEECIGYEEYLKSKHWFKTRVEIFRRDNHHCQMCNKALELRDANVHHKTYDNVGKEHPEDLILLCPDCHKKVHQISKRKYVKKDWKERNWKKKTYKKSRA